MVVVDPLDAAGALASDVTELAAGAADPTLTVLESPDELELGALVAVELPPPAPEPVELWLLGAGEESDATLEAPDAASPAPPALDPAATVTVELWALGVDDEAGAALGLAPPVLAGSADPGPPTCWVEVSADA